MNTTEIILYNLMEYGGHLIDGLLIVILLRRIFPASGSHRRRTAWELFSVLFTFAALSMTHIWSSSSSAVWGLVLKGNTTTHDGKSI